MIILDGGMGRELARMGAPFRQPEWSALALMEDPDSVHRAHDNFVAAGARVISSNAYAVVPFHIGEERFRERGAELAELAARLAREAADAAPHDCRVAASVPPLFGSYRPDLFDEARARQLWPVIIDAQLPHCDVLLPETLASIAESLTALDLCAPHGKPVWLSATLVDDRPLLRSGETVGDWVGAIMESAGWNVVGALLFNCSQPEVMAAAVAEAARARGDGGWKIGVYANSFPAQGEKPRANSTLHDLRADLTPDLYVQFAEGWRDAGADIIGGCCGIGPDHIRALADRLGE